MRATTPGEVIMLTTGAVFFMLAQHLGIAPYFFVIVAFLYVTACIKERRA